MTADMRGGDSDALMVDVMALYWALKKVDHWDNPQAVTMVGLMVFHLAEEMVACLAAQSVFASAAEMAAE